jgi:hypothetical protein
MATVSMGRLLVRHGEMCFDCCCRRNPELTAVLEPEKDFLYSRSLSQRKNIKFIYKIFGTLETLHKW